MMVDSVYGELEPGDLPVANRFLHEPVSTQQREAREKNRSIRVSVYRKEGCFRLAS